MTAPCRESKCSTGGAATVKTVVVRIREMIRLDRETYIHDYKPRLTSDETLTGLKLNLD